MNYRRIDETQWLAAFPARGWVAAFSTDGRRGRKFAYVRVEAWADSGEALIVDKRHGRLEPATANPAFVHLEQASQQGRQPSEVEITSDDEPKEDAA